MLRAAFFPFLSVFPSNPGPQRPLSQGKHINRSWCPHFGRDWGLSPPACPCSGAVCFPAPAGYPGSAGSGAAAFGQTAWNSAAGSRPAPPSRHRRGAGTSCVPPRLDTLGCSGLGSLGMLWFGVPRVWGLWGCSGCQRMLTLGVPGVAWVWGPWGLEVLVWGLWGPQGCSGSLKMLRFGVPRDGPDLESLRMLRFGVPRDAAVWAPWGCSGSLKMLRLGVPRDTQIWGPQGCSNSGQEAEETPLFPPSRMRPLKLQCWVWSEAEMPARTGCAGAHFLGCRRLGSAHGGSSCPAQPQGGGQAAQPPPSPSGGLRSMSRAGTTPPLFPFIPCLCLFPFSLKRGFLSYFGLAFWLLSSIILI